MKVFHSGMSGKHLPLCSNNAELFLTIHSKASIIIFEGLAYKADTEPSLGGDPNEPRRTVMSHINRRLTHQEYWLQLDRDREMGVDRFEQYPAVPPPNADKVFLPFPNKLVGGFGTPDMHPDEDALASIPTPGHLWQYVPREIKPELVSGVVLVRFRITNTNV
jgi:hypothetical protein